MIKAGATREAINAFWMPIRRSFTRGGGFAGLEALGRWGGRLNVMLNVWGVVEEIQHMRAGDAWVPTPGHESTFPVFGEWAPAGSFEAQCPGCI